MALSSSLRVCRKLDGSSQLLASARKYASSNFQDPHDSGLHQVPHAHERLAKQKDKDGVEEDVPLCCGGNACTMSVRSAGGQGAAESRVAEGAATENE